MSKEKENAFEEASGEQESSSEEYRVRLEKVVKMRERGIEPWPSIQKIEHQNSADVVAQFIDEASATTIAVVGRVMTMRDHGKSIFVHVQDSTGRLQIYLKDELGTAFNLFNQYIDLGDIIWVEGVPFRTKTGEITLRVSAYKLLSKSLHPLPEKFHGISDVEIRYRQRYLDLITSPEVRERFLARSRMVTALRSALDEQGYVEVETPMLHPIAGGAAARPFTTHHNALGDDFYLRIAPELYLKRLVVGGIERVYELNRNFRNEGISPRHNPEFSMIEIYTAYQDLSYAMDLVEQLIRTAAYATGRTLQVPFGGTTLDFEQPFRRITMFNAVLEYGGFDEMELAPEHITALCARHNLSVVAHASYGHKLAALFEHVAESKLIQPTFIHSFPIELSPLAKRDPANPNFSPRFELFVGGMELSNAYHELNDPLEQAERFREQLALHAAGDEEAHQYDADYVVALEHALPPTVGIGIGIDRLAMLLTNAPSIKEVILFPTLKRTQR